MKTLLVTGRPEQDVEMLKEFGERMGLHVRELTEQQKEDIGLANAIKQGRRTPTVSKASVLRALRRA